MEDYTTAGFDKFLTRKQDPQTPEDILEDEGSLRIDETLGSKTFTGKSTSADGLLEIDWDNRKITVNDNVRDRVVVGYIAEEGKYGVRVTDSSGTDQLDETYT